MKESKNFFTNNNRLNKGYSKVSSIRESDGSFYRKKFEHVLPPVELMAEYENIYPGTLERIMNMAQKEQAHRHEIDLRNLKAHENTAKVSKICALIFGIFLLALIILLISIREYIALGTLILLSIVFIVFNLQKTTRKHEYLKSKHHQNMH
jgi:uncharacterized membrane protein